MDTRAKLNALKEKHGLSNQKIADLSNVPIGTVSGIMSGQTAQPGFEAVCAMLTAMGESIDEFYTGVPAEMPQAVASGDAAEHQTVVAEHHHHIRIMPLHGDVAKITQDAIKDVYAGEAYRIVHSNLKWWRAIALVLIMLVIGWFTWDITHPNVGLIQYGSIAPASTSLDIRPEELA